MLLYQISAFTELAAFGNTIEKGIPPTNDICFKYISIAVAIGIPNCANTLSSFFYCNVFCVTSKSMKYIFDAIASHCFD